MKIAFDLRRIKNPGIGRYMKCLVEAVVAHAPEHEYLLVLPPDGEDLISARTAGVEKVSPDLKYYSVREQIELPRILRRYKVDLLHSPHFLLPLVRPCPALVTIHDVIYLACKQDMPSLAGRLYYRGMITASARLAERIVTDSEFSKSDIIRYLNVDPAKIDVVYPGVDPTFQPVTEPAQLQSVRTKFRIDSDYILYTGIYRLRKNHAGLLRAFRLFRENGGRAQLVLAGPMKEGEPELRRLSADLGVAENVVFTGFVSDLDLPALYSGARVYACPSLYEGFGFTALEAMACGTPVVSSPATSLSEVAGDAAVYSDSNNPEEFAGSLHRAFTDAALRSTLVDKGKKNLQRFNWANAAVETLAVYQHVLQAPLPKAAYA